MIRERLRKSIFRLPPYLLEVICVVASALLFASGLFIPAAPWLKNFIFISCVILTGYDIVIDTATKLIRESEFNADFLVVLAAAGAFGINKGAEGAAVLLIFKIGELTHTMLVKRSANAVESFVDLRPETVNAVINGAIVQMASGKINVGDIISVSPGEHVALDGIVVSGDSQINTLALYGDTEPLQVADGSEVLSGSVNLTGVLNLKVTADFDHSTVSRILQLLVESENRKAEPEKKIRKIARIYAPAAAAAALILGILVPLFGGLPLSPWLNRALGILVVTSPAAFLASVSLTYFAGTGGAAKNGIIFKGADVIDTISHTTSVIFDKTGTLTDAMLRVVGIHAYGISENRLLMLAAYAELFSAHPIARAIVEAAGIKPDFAKVTDYREFTGKGTEIIIDGNTITAGSALLMKELGVKYDISKDDFSVVYIAVNGRYAGRILLSDNIRLDSKKAVRDLRTIGIDRIAIFTGDKKEAAADIAGQLGIKEYYAECLPEDKISRLKGLLDMQLKGDKLIYVGGSIDDAPILKMADVGIAIGGLISDETTDAADMVIMSDEPSKIAAAITLARNTDKIVRQNVVLALAWKGFLLLLTALGIVPLWVAALADAAFAVVFILNAGKAFRIKEPLRKHKR